MKIIKISNGYIIESPDNDGSKNNEILCLAIKLFLENTNEQK
jgi:hypothetical protein